MYHKKKKTLKKRG